MTASPPLELIENMCPIHNKTPCIAAGCFVWSSAVTCAFPRPHPCGLMHACACIRECLAKRHPCRRAYLPHAVLRTAIVLLSHQLALTLRKPGQRRAPFAAPCAAIRLLSHRPRPTLPQAGAVCSPLRGDRRCSYSGLVGTFGSCSAKHPRIAAIRIACEDCQPSVAAYRGFPEYSKTPCIAAGCFIWSSAATYLPGPLPAKYCQRAEA